MDGSALRVGDFPMPEHWKKLCAVTEQLVRNVGNEKGETSEVLQQHLQVVATHREKMQQIEVELRAQIIARSKIADFKKCCSAEVQGLMKEKVHEKEQHMIQTLQRIVEEKDKELNAVKNDNEAKQRQIIELQEQGYRVSQENITSKDEQLMNAKEWPMQFQAVDVWQLGSLQAELQGQTTHPQEIDGPQSHCIQESEGEIEQQQALPETSFYKKSGRRRIRMLDECLVHPASENDVQENVIDCNRIHALIGDANNIGGNLRYKDITGADIIGMRFESFEAAEDFYRRYAIAIGFSIRKQDLRRKPNGALIMQKWVCNREGKRRQNYVDEDNKQWNRRPITRVGCPASFRVNMNSVGKWTVKQAILEHNHELTPMLDDWSLPDESLLRMEKRLKTQEPDDVDD